jgi:hypothetical protein
MATTSREPNTPYTALVRHVINDGPRTRRTLALILVIAFAGSITLGVVVAAVALTGTGTVLASGGALSGFAGGWLGGRLWSLRQTAKETQSLPG